DRPWHVSPGLLTSPWVGYQEPASKGIGPLILTQTHKRRSFVGSLNAGADHIESFRRLCVHNANLCGFFNGCGYLRDRRVRAFDAARKRHTEPTLHSGLFQVVSLTGNISLTGRDTSIRCHAIGVSKAASDGDIGTAGYV